MAAIDLVAVRTRALAGMIGPTGRARAWGSLPPGAALRPGPALPPDAEDHVRERLGPAIAALEATLPLRRDPHAATWEGLSLGIVDGRAWLTCRNLLGAGERMHVFTPGQTRHERRAFVDWFAARDRPLAGTSWDAARTSGRVVMGEEAFAAGGTIASYVDPGAVRLVEIASAVGATTVYSCEGHPAGGYLVMRDGPGARALSGAAAAIGWKVGTMPGRSLVSVYMPAPADFDARDTAWRRACDAFERMLGLAPDAGRDLLAALNLHQAAEAGPPSPTP